LAFGQVGEKIKSETATLNTRHRTKTNKKKDAKQKDEQLRG